MTNNINLHTKDKICKAKFTSFTKVLKKDNGYFL